MKEQLKRSAGYKARLLTEQLPSTTRSKHNSQTPESPVTHISCVGQCASHTRTLWVILKTLLHQNSAREAGKTQSLLDLEDLPLDKVKLNLRDLPKKRSPSIKLKALKNLSNRQRCSIICRRRDRRYDNKLLDTTRTRQ